MIFLVVGEGQGGAILIFLVLGGGQGEAALIFLVRTWLVGGGVWL